MTINIALVTNEALVFGCDSIASTVGHMVDPFSLTWQKDAAGNYQKDASGNPLVALEMSKIEPVVTNAWGGVTKMFCLHEGKTPVVAVTAGMAKFRDGRTIKSLAEEFAEKQRGRAKPFVRVEAVANEFLRFFHRAYSRHYLGSAVLPQYRDELNFLIGGYGRDDAFPSLYRIKVRENTINEDWAKGKSGLSWEGQSDGVERLIRGYDGNLRGAVESYLQQAFADHHQQMTDAVARIVNDVLAKLGAAMPAGVDTSLPGSAQLTLPWDNAKLWVTYASLPVQDAVRLVSFLVNLQSGRSKFAYGVATVGGRTHIGVVTKTEGFKMLDEPILKHTDRGFGDDF